MSNFVFIATSLDGFIAKPDGNIDWLNDFGNLENEDFGYNTFISGIDAIIMGRNTFEKVKSFEIWPYELPVYVISQSLVAENKLPRYVITNNPPEKIIQQLKNEGLKNFYIDGGKTIQSFLNLNMIDELIITTLPIILGDGIPLFRKVPANIRLELKKLTNYSNGFVQSHYIIK